MNFNWENLKKDVQFEFNKIREAVNVREQLLVRQLEVICNTNQSYLNKNNIATSSSSSTTITHDLENSNNSIKNIDEIKFISDRETILCSIRNFGKFNLDNVNFAKLLYVNEDEPEQHDTSTMIKCLENITQFSNASTTPIITSINGDGKDITTTFNNNEVNEEKVCIDFSNNRKLITDNVTNLNESVINITLNETKELIKKSSTSPCANLYEIGKTSPKSVESVKTLTPINQTKSIVASSTTSTSNVTRTTVESKKPKKTLKLKPKITINNCNGVINLKNISSLTINCANKDLMNVDPNTSHSENVDDIDESLAESQPIFSTENGDNDDNEEEITSEISTENVTTNDSTTTKDNENYVNCEFYNRLINEIKNTLKQQAHQHAQAHAHNINNNNDIHIEEIPLSGGESSTTLTTPNTNNNSSRISSSKNTKKLLLKNFENLKIILEKNENDSTGKQQHPVQIEQWLAEIISETEVEPMQNTEILELSKIHSESGNTNSNCNGTSKDSY